MCVCDYGKIFWFQQMYIEMVTYHIYHSFQNKILISTTVFTIDNNKNSFFSSKLTYKNNLNGELATENLALHQMNIL